VVGREALRHGRGGIQRMVDASGLSKPTILKGIRELQGKGELIAEEGRVRKPGGGRKPVEAHDPDITRLLEQVMDESTVGDPMSPLKWNSRSTYQIQQYLASHGHPVSETLYSGDCGNSTIRCRLTRKTKRANPTRPATGSFVISIGRRNGFGNRKSPSFRWTRKRRNVSETSRITGGNGIRKGRHRK
jgi:hypothetical protein